ncbi:MAG: hypothetical protein F4Y24_17950 [Gemmatimonadetes bacterium]|nr:hypothetical protein [Gemmatimonadota bacterium]MYG21597.1 hypothetical protein [Gemmatimonadota bacterium]MYJ39478.1 hypothetical protein [Gemmatimonadota bacterium]
MARRRRETVGELLATLVQVNELATLDGSFLQPKKGTPEAHLNKELDRIKQIAGGAIAWARRSGLDVEGATK